MAANPTSDRRQEAPGIPPASPLGQTLTSLRSRLRRLLVAGSAMRIGAWAIAIVIGLALVDYFLRLPQALRIAQLVVGLMVLAYAAWRFIRPAMRFRPSLTDLALRLERSPLPGATDVRGLLASGVDLASHASDLPSAPPMEQALASEVVRDASARAALVRRLATRIVAPRKVVVAAVAMLLAVGVALGAHLAWPSMATTGVQRILTPWTNASWPKPTQILDVTDAQVHPMGAKLEIAGLLTRTPSAPGKTTVFVRTKVLIPGRDPVETRQRLVSQLRDELRGGRRGELFLGEVSIPPAEDGGAIEGWLEYTLETAHDATPTARVPLVAPPRIRSASVVIDPPAYVSGVSGFEGSGTRDLGPGVDERAVVGPLLAGSHVRMSIAVNKPLPPEANTWVGAFLEACDPAAPAVVRFEERTIELEGVLASTVRLDAHLQDEYGLGMTDEQAVFGLDVVLDEPPSVSILEPLHDQAVLPGAVVRVLAEGRDDVAVRSIALEHQAARLPVGSSSGAAELVGDWTRFASQSLADDTLRQARALADFELTPLALRPGEEVWLTALAEDNFQRDDQRHEVVRSAPRRLVIISETTFVERIRNELNGVRQAAQRIDDRQRDTAGRLSAVGATEGAAQDQRAISEQIRSQQEVLDRLAERLDVNRLDDQALADLIDEARAAAGAAAAASERAAAAVEQAQQADETEAEQAAEAQSEVRDELLRLAEMLDRGQDGWLARRDVERLLEAQQELIQETESVAGRTAGRSLEQLTPQERSELERIALRQQELAERAEQVLDSLSERSRDLSEADPAQAAGLAQASTRGRQDQVADQMRNASQDVQRNQPGRAGGSQQQAADSLSDMLEDINSAERNRDEMLRRALASIIESLESLVAQQRRELQALVAARPARAFDGLAEAQFRVQANTLGVLDQVEQAGGDLALVARMVSDAAEAQGSAVGALRVDPILDDKAEGFENTALQRLEQARDEARRAEQEAAERDQSRRRAELRAAYRGMLEQQVALRSEADPFQGQELSRRDRQRVRTLGEKQRTLRESIAELRAATTELEDAAMFRFAHDRLDADAAAAADGLLTGEVSASTRRRQDSVVRVLQSLVEALAENPQQQDFRDQQGSQQGQGQGGQSGQTPPLFEAIAELKLLRSMQQEAMERTRALDEANEPGSPDLQAELQDVAELQDELMRLGDQLIQKMTRPSGGAPPNPFDGYPNLEGGR